jgi:hypothetical protein
MSLKSLTARAAKNKIGAKDTMVLDYKALYREVCFKTLTKDRPKPCIDKDLERAFDEYINLTVDEELATALNHLQCKEENLRPLKVWIRAVTGAEDPVHIAAMAHWLWLVKRKAYQKEAIHHIMPILYGPQGGGKTKALEYLLKPISEYQLSSSMHTLDDEKIFASFATNYVVLYDELQGFRTASIEAIKRQITTARNTYRQLYTHSQVTVPQLCSFIGATNKPIKETFSDSTGMRRFWEIKALKKLDWQTVREIDYAELWRGIDERSELGYLKGDMLSQVSEIQRRMVNEDSWELFVQETQLLPVEGVATEAAPLSRIFENYLIWMGTNGYQKPSSSHRLADRLETKLAVEITKDERSRAVKSFIINSQSSIFDISQPTNVLKLGARK